MQAGHDSTITGLAKAGIVSKGIVYVVLGMLAIMSAFEIGGKSNEATSKTGVFTLVKELPAGVVLLIILTLGLVCYTAWRFIQAYHVTRQSRQIQWSKGFRYVASAITYLLLAFSAFQLILHNNQSNGDQNQYWAEEILEKPLGQWLLGLAALIMAATGIYQVWYGLSGHYKKHVDEQSFNNKTSSLVLLTGKIGYEARGIVWLILAWLLLKAAINANPSEAGDTTKAFQFLEQGSSGSLMLGALGLGLVAYGIFNFIRAAYETFKV